VLLVVNDRPDIARLAEADGVHLGQEDLTVKDARRIPTALKKWLWARDETCRAPGCNRPATRCDIDHTRRYEHQGPTEPENLVCYCRGHHGAKDDGCWQVTPLPGNRLRWRSRWGTEVITEPARRGSPLT